MGLGLGVVPWKVADPYSWSIAFLLMLIDDMFIFIEIVEQTRLIALECYKIDVTHNLWLDYFESFGVEEQSTVL